MENCPFATKTLSTNFYFPSHEILKLAGPSERVFKVLLLGERFANKLVASEEPKSGAVKSDDVECFLSRRNRKHSRSLNSVTCDAAEKCADDTYPLAVRKRWDKSDPKALTRKTLLQGPTSLQSGIILRSRLPFMAAESVGVSRCSWTVNSEAVAWCDGVTPSSGAEASPRVDGRPWEDGD